MKYDEPSIGRVITAPEVRGSGLGRALMREGLARCARSWPGQAHPHQRAGAAAPLLRRAGFRGRCPTTTSRTTSRTSRCCGDRHETSRTKSSTRATPLADVNLFAVNLPLQDALAWHHPGYDRARFDALGAEAGSAEMQVHARLANLHSPRAARARPLRPPHRPGRVPPELPRADAAARCATGLHGTPWTEGAGAHVERAAAFMLFTELEPSILCPVSMSYAVTPALRANAGAVRRTGCPSWRAPVRRALPALRAEDGRDHGHGHDREAGRLRRARQHHARRVRRRRRLGPALPHHRPQVVHVGADVRRLPGAGADGRPA